jgi:hypothetical protein
MVNQDCDGSQVCAQVASSVKNTFEVNPLGEDLALGTLPARRSPKALRLIDRRQQRRRVLGN